MDYIAHTDAGREQTVLKHLQGTAKLAKEFADVFGAGEIAEFTGMLHDIGKYSDAFQQRIRGANLRVDHSTAGAIEARKRKCIPAAFCIAGHHGGLPNGGSKPDAVPQSATLMGRFARKPGRDIEEYGAFESEIHPPACTIPNQLMESTESQQFFIRMLYSCLVDADWLDTERFMKEGKVQRGGFAPLSEYADKLKKKIAPWLEKPSGVLGEKRNEILRSALTLSESSPGMFTLTAPTGSGKTISSMAFALSHAIQHGLTRVIYVIPYCSIIDQTQSVFESIFGSGSVVAHHSNVDYKSEEDSRDKRYLAAENWDAPVILTTNVQFFESLYANKSSRCRKLHNIANSVIIFDEAQMLPTSYLLPCVHAIAQLVAHYGCSAVLCTATQPALSSFFETALPGYPLREICPKPKEMYDLFKRVRYETLGKLTDDELAERLAARSQALCVVNRRDQAQALFGLLPKEGRFHLSTTMYPAHRRAVIEEIKRRLEKGLVCRVVSTSLVEAGVDFSFPVVYRGLAGLDSIVQAGGRCNREGIASLRESVVYIFESERKAPRMLQQNIASARMVLEKYLDPGAPEAIERYFNDLFKVAKGPEALDEKKILKKTSGADCPFQLIAEEFRIIETSERTLYIPCPESKPLLDRLEKDGPDRMLMRELGAYSVGVYPQHYQELTRAGAIREIADGAGVLQDMKHYDAEMGLKLTIQEGTSSIV